MQKKYDSDVQATVSIRMDGDPRPFYRRRRLMLATALGAMALAPMAHPDAHAQARRPKPAPAGQTPARHAAARPAARHAQAAEPRSAEALSVVGSHETSHGMEQTITRKTLNRFVAGTSPLQVLGATTPGVSFATADALGLDTYANSLYIRGYNQSQLGVTLDGIPLGDQGFINTNGLDINEAVTPDNIARIDMSQGGGALDVASTANLGGALQYYTLDPRDTLGADVSQTFGSNSTYRTFGRFHSGVLNQTGTKFMASYARTDAQKWKGHGNQYEQQANFKFVQPLGDRGQLTGFFDYSQFNQYNYGNISLEIKRKLGSRTDYFYPDYKGAYLAAQGIFPAGWDQVSSPTDIAYYDAAQDQRNYLTGLNGKYDLTSRLRLKSVLYAQVSGGDYEFTNPYVSSPNGAPMIQQADHQWFRRVGGTLALQYRLGHHDLESGVWYENNDFTYAQRLYSQPLLGEGTPRKGTGPYKDSFATRYGVQMNTNAFQYYLQDAWHILPTLRLHAGFKSLLVTTAGGAFENNETYTGQSMLPSGSLTTAGAFLPHVSLNWTFLQHHELFFDVSRNMRAYSYGGWNSPVAWGVDNQAIFSQLRKTLKPESTWNYLIGYRYNSRYVDGVLNLYHSDYSNRLAPITSGTLVNANQTFLNVGSMAMWGVDAGVTVRPLPHLEIFNSISYNHSTYGQGIYNAGTYYDLKGKMEVNYPSVMYKSNVAYTYGDATLNFNVYYMGRRYLSYMNDTSVDPYWNANLTASYDFKHIPHVAGLNFSLGIYNLFNQEYISAIGANPISGDRQSMFAGAPRQFFGTVRARF